MEEEMEGRKADDGGRSFKTGTDQVIGVTSEFYWTGILG